MDEASNDKHLHEVFAKAFHEVAEPHLEEIKTFWIVLIPGLIKWRGK